MADVVDVALAILAVLVGCIEDLEVFVEEPRSTLYCLTSADHIVCLTDLVVRESEGRQHVEASSVVLLRGEAESLHRRLAKRPLVECKTDLEYAWQRRLYHGDVLACETL